MTTGFNRPEPDPAVIFITGDLHSGKTSLAGRLVDRFRSCGYRIAGILSKGFWQDDIRSSFEVEDLFSRRTALLATRTSEFESHGMAFSFKQDGIETGRLALQPEICRKADVVIIDEIGKLELNGDGWAPCIQNILALPEILHIWIVRAFLVQDVCRKWDLKIRLAVDCAEPDALNILTRKSERILSGWQQHRIC